jgi:signal transduction histidine kinase
MAQASEYIEFRRAFVWLLCGMLLPSVALVAFGVVAVANERAAVERRLAEEYETRLRTLEHEIHVRLDQVADAAARGLPDPLVNSVKILDPVAPPPGLEDAVRSASTLPIGGHLLVGTESQGLRHAWALIRAVGPVGERTLIAHLDLAALADEVPALSRARFPRERAGFRLLPPREGGLAALKRIVAEAGNATIVARVGLGPPLEGFALVAELPGGDPAAALALRNRSLYIALLVLLYVGIGVGFGLTLREMRRAYKLSRLKTDFVANISHELRTPLTSVRLFAETLREGRAESPEEVRECIELLSSEAERLSKLVEKLLSWSRLESGQRMLDKQPTAVPALLDEIAAAYRAQQLPATYDTELEPGLPQVDVDRDAMAQVVLNLLHNAVKYTGAVKRIRLRARRAGKSVAVEVVDNGPGVRAKDRKRIFERFYRGDDLLSRQTEGTGLGLAICKKIVEAHGGRIELDSRMGEGSTFRILLPAGDA